MLNVCQEGKDLFFLTLSKRNDSTKGQGIINGSGTALYTTHLMHQSSRLYEQSPISFNLVFFKYFSI